MGVISFHGVQFKGRGCNDAAFFPTVFVRLSLVLAARNSRRFTEQISSDFNTLVVQLSLKSLIGHKTSLDGCRSIPVLMFTCSASTSIVNYTDLCCRHFFLLKVRLRYRPLRNMKRSIDSKHESKLKTKFKLTLL